MKTVIILLAFSFFFTNAGSGQTVNVGGKVVDKNTLNPLNGVNISLENNDLSIGTITNQKGEFRLWNLPGDSLRIRVSHSGYKVSLIDVATLQNPTENTLFVIELEKKSKSGRSNTNERKLAFLKKKLVAKK